MTSEYALQSILFSPKLDYVLILFSVFELGSIMRGQEAYKYRGNAFRPTSALNLQYAPMKQHRVGRFLSPASPVGVTICLTVGFQIFILS